HLGAPVLVRRQTLPRRYRDVLPDRHGLEQPYFLERAAQAGSAADVRRIGGAIAAEESDAPARRRQVAADDFEQSRLTGAVGADQTHHLALGDAERHVAQRDQAAEPLGDVGDFERGGVAHDSLRARARVLNRPMMPLGAYMTTASKSRP